MVFQLLREIEVQQVVHTVQNSGAYGEPVGVRRRVEDPHAGTAGATVAPDQLHADPGQAVEVRLHRLGQSALRDGPASPSPGVLHEKEGGIRRRRTGQWLAVVAAAHVAAEVVTS
ncbi:hypothetical protein [Nocardioides sp. B-3]|uniref:hypothetical protein n=1 Tax=Nocardioides sp. B-3 TaxID=2895565 RepID=UPI0021529FE8|nr:hypothetical protein [Nocardioides sp. B-3]UUZ61417.1 hypothetical protein LP418_13080 [Nocardioides sp. B-3]